MPGEGEGLGGLEGQPCLVKEKRQVLWCVL